MSNNSNIIMLKTDLIIPNKNQPRKHFDKESLDNLANSIKTYGILYPILVHKVDNNYEIIAGERRYRAAKKIGMEEVPVIIKEISQQKVNELALIENILRTNLNVIEEANAFQEIITKENITQEEFAQRIGKSQAYVANKIRLLALPETIKNALINSKISERHARVLLTVKDDSKKNELLEEIIKNKLTIKELEKKIKKEEKEDDNMNNGSFFPNFNNQTPTSDASNATLNTLNQEVLQNQYINPAIVSQPSNPQPVNSQEGFSYNPSTATPTPEVNNSNPTTQTVINPTTAPVDSLWNVNNNFQQSQASTSVPEQNVASTSVAPQTNPIINNEPLFGIGISGIETPQEPVNNNPTSIPVVDEPLFNPNVVIPQVNNQEPLPQNASIVNNPTQNITNEPNILTPPVTQQGLSSPDVAPTEIPLSTQPVIEVPDLPTNNDNVQVSSNVLTLEGYLKENNYNYKLYNSLDTDCIIIEIPKK